MTAATDTAALQARIAELEAVWSNHEALHENLLRSGYPRRYALHLAGATDYDAIKARNAELEAPAGFDSEFLSKRLARVAKLAGVPMPSMTHEQIAECAGTILGTIASKLEAASKAGSAEQAEPTLESAIERGTKAWSGTPDNWLEELRGNDTAEGSAEQVSEREAFEKFASAEGNGTWLAKNDNGSYQSMEIGDYWKYFRNGYRAAIQPAPERKALNDDLLRRCECEIKHLIHCCSEDAVPFAGDETHELLADILKCRAVLAAQASAQSTDAKDKP